MARFYLTDGNGSDTITAESMKDAKRQARELWPQGDWGEGKAEIDVRVVELDDEGEEIGESQWVTVEVGEDPEAPECTADEHEWVAPYRVVGGIKENPGVWSRGGTTIQTKRVCRHCGCYLVETAYGSQRNPGQCDKVEYREADETSLAWIAERNAATAE